MVIGIFGESCTGKSTLAAELAKTFSCRIYSGKDYLRLAKSEPAAKIAFRNMLQDAVHGENIIYVISEREHMTFLPEETLRILVTADINDIKSRFSQRMGGKLPKPVEMMLEKRHGCFDEERCHIHVISGADHTGEIIQMLQKIQSEKR